jgi:hypothetical protein
LHGVFLHPWDLEMSTKTCSNNMVSPNDHVVMNPQNQTPNKRHMRPCSLQWLHATEIVVAQVPWPVLQEGLVFLC